MRIRDRHAEIFGKNWLSKNQGHRRKLITDVTDNWCKLLIFACRPTICTGELTWNDSRHNDFRADIADTGMFRQALSACFSLTVECIVQSKRFVPWGEPQFITFIFYQEFFPLDPHGFTVTPARFVPQHGADHKCAATPRQTTRLLAWQDTATPHNQFAGFFFL